MSLPIEFTDTFAEGYAHLPVADVAAVDLMLDRLEEEHHLPHMRAIIPIGDRSLFATPRISARRGLYRITWTYDQGDSPTSIVCLTVARVET